MNLTKKRNRKWLFPLLAFLVPMCGMLLIMLCSQYTPFGKYSMLYSDMYHQYFPFFKAFRRALLSGDSLLYTWSVGLGMDYLGLISYYLASPLNLLSILVPENCLLSYFSILVPVKLGLASLFFALFLKKTFGKNDVSITLFGSFYGLCAWALGYQWNIMWLDTFALLPLVIMGTLSLLKERRFFLYTVTLFLSVVSNYYIGFFTCIFVLLVFICYEICRWQGFRRFWSDLWHMALFSVLAIGITAFLEIPTLAALQNTQSSVNKFPKGFKLNIADENTWKGLLNAMVQVAGNMNGCLEPTFKEGLPNLYCGVLTTVLAFLYLTMKNVRLRDKFCTVGLLIFFNLSFIIRQLDYIWHGFHFTNMIPYRFSFLYSFVMLYMAYTAFIHRRTLRVWQIASALLLSLCIILCGNPSKPIAWVYNLGFLAIYGITLFVSQYRRNNQEINIENIVAYVQQSAERKRICTIVLSITMALELALNLVNFAIWFPGTSIENYPSGKEDTKQVIDYMKEQEKATPFYRAETTHSQTLNDGALNNYNGITTFTSSANVHVTEFMKALGYGAKNTYNRYCFEESSPVANLFLDLKYMLERNGELKENPYFSDVYQMNQVHLLKNNYYLPLGFLANSQLMNVKFIDSGNPFALQNQIFKAATGLQENIWNTTWGRNLEITASNAELGAASILNGHCSYTVSPDTAGTVTYTYHSDRAGFMCIYIDQSKRYGYDVILNGEKLYSETYSLPQMLSVSQVYPGDTVEITFKCKKDESGSINIIAGLLDPLLFQRGYDVLSQSVMDVTEMKNTYIKADINCNREGVLYTSIPENGNWKVILDGNETEPVLIGDVMTGLLMKKGQHEIIFKYENRAFHVGLAVSIVCLCCFLLAECAALKRRNCSGKHLK